jgi:hypothetical protein
MNLQGKGFFTFNLAACEGGEPVAIVAAAQQAGLSHVFVKIADGTKPAGINDSGIDSSAPVVEALRKAGIAVWGWQSIYGDNPTAEAVIAITRTQELELDGYVIQAGEEYQQPGRSNVARQFMTEIRSALKLPIALSSFRFPNYHPMFPWSTFLEFCDLHMPQVFWEQGNNTAAQIRESKRQCDSLPNARPYIPTGAAYCTPGWNPTANEVGDFLNTARNLGLPAVNFFYWEECRASLPLLWTTIADFSWPIYAQDNPPGPTNPIPQVEIPPDTLTDPFLLQFLAALNSHNADQTSGLYDTTAMRVWADQILQGSAAIQAGLASFFSGLPTGTVFTIQHAQVEDDMSSFTWKAGLITGETMLVVKNGKIVLDYTFIS